MEEKPHVSPVDGLNYVTSEAFLATCSHQKARWDREWVRYFGFHDIKWYFYNMNSPNYWFSIPKKDIARFGAAEIFGNRLRDDKPETKLGIRVPGEKLVGKHFLELGCGPGVLGKMCSRICERYVGIDYSPLALSIARLVSPENCSYYCIDESEDLKSLANSIDVCAGRHFFIHQNFENSIWILSLFRDFLRPGGFVSADFYSGKEMPKGSITYPTKSPLDPKNASCMFYYSDDEIKELAKAVGLDVEIAETIDDPPRTFAIFQKMS